MDEEKRQSHSGHSHAALLMLAIVALLLFYVLSSGPALWFVVNARLPAALWNVTYWPLTFARDVIPGFHEYFQWYLNLWV